MNKVILIGRLSKEPELRTTPSNVSVATFNLAVNRPYNPEKEQQEADFINCVVWKKQAENLVKYCHKGSQIAIEGRIRTRNYTANDGTKRYVTEVMCSSITFLGSPQNNNSATSQSQNDAVESTVDTMVKQESDPFADFGEEITLNDDDLPF